MFTNKQLVMISLVLVSVFSIIFISPSASALTSQQALSQCNIKVKKQACINAVNKCEGLQSIVLQGCLNKALSPATAGITVIEGCQTSPDPQACQKSVSTTCKGKTGNDLVACQGAATSSNGGENPSLNSIYLEKKYYCGKVDKIYTQFDLGCRGNKGPDSGILDLAFSIVRFLTIGVGIALTMSIIYAGIQYSTSGGNPEQTSKAKQRILNAMIGLIFFLLISALAQFLVPGGLF